MAFAFPLWTFTVAAGAIWAEYAWGRYWGWDPKETWALVTWVVYACYLHARSTAGWRGTPGRGDRPHRGGVVLVQLRRHQPAGLRPALLRRHLSAVPSAGARRDGGQRSLRSGRPPIGVAARTLRPSETGVRQAA